MDQIEFMRDDLKLTAAFLLLNFSVVALAIAGYQKSGMHLDAVLSHLTLEFGKPVVSSRHQPLDHAKRHCSE